MAQQVVGLLGRVEPGAKFSLLILSGSCVELVAKAVVASASPALVAAGGKDEKYVSILHLSGSGHLTKEPITKVRTSTAEEVVQLSVELYGTLGKFKPSVARLVEARNCAAHMGHASMDVEAAFAAMAEYIEAALQILGLTREEFWPPTAIPAVDATLGGHDSKVDLALATKLSEAKNRFKSLVEGLQQGRREQLLQLLENRALHDSGSDFDEAVSCPACGQRGWASYRQQPKQVETTVGSYTMLSIDGVLDEFECPVCQLKLDLEEALKAGIPPTAAAPVPDYEPDEDEWRDR